MADAYRLSLKSWAGTSRKREKKEKEKGCALLYGTRDGVGCTCGVIGEDQERLLRV